MITSDSPTSGMSRRSFTRALAWSAPVVAVAIAAPAASASGALQADAFAISDVQVGESTGLSLRLTQNGTDLADGTSIIVTLADTSVLEFDPDADGYLSATAASATVTGGIATAVVLVRSAGATAGVVAQGASQASFSVSVTTA